MHGRPQRLAGEFIGTFGVVLFSVSAICADQFLRSQNQPALGALGISLAYGLVYGALVTAVGYSSSARGCGHLNPAVTLGFWGARKLGTFDALSYCIAQLAGAAAAAFSLRAVLPEEVWRPVELGTPALANGITRAPGMLIEGFATFFLVFTVFSTALDGRDPSGIQRGTRWLTGLVGGLIVATGALFTLPFTGGSMNPARAFGPALAGHYWTNHGVYWIGPLSGGVVAAWLYDSVFLRWHASVESEERSGAHTD